MFKNSGKRKIIEEIYKKQVATLLAITKLYSNRYNFSMTSIQDKINIKANFKFVLVASFNFTQSF